MSSKKNQEVSLPLLVCALTIFFIFNMDAGAVNIILIKISGTLNISVGQMQWIMSINLLGFAAVMVAAGKLGDILGYTKVIAIGSTLLIIGEFICATTSSFPVMLGGRLLEGIGGAFMLPNLIILILMYFGDNKGLGSGLIAATGGLALILGPLEGGAIAQLLSWRLLFTINGILLIIPTIIFFFSIKKKISTKKESLDIAGAGFLAFSIVFLLLFISNLSAIADNLLLVILYLGLFIISTLIFFVVEQKIKVPLIDFKMLKEYPHVLIGCFIRFVFFGIFYIIFYVIGVVFQARGVSSIQTAMLLLPLTVIIVISSPIVGKITDKHGVRSISLLAGLFMVLSPVLLIYFLVIESWFLFFIAMAMFGVTYAILNTSTIKYSLSSIPKEAQGTLSGILYMFGLIPGAICMTLAGVILAYNKTIISNSKQMLYTSFRENMLLCLLLGIIGALLIVFYLKDHKPPKAIADKNEKAS